MKSYWILAGILAIALLAASCDTVDQTMAPASDEPEVTDLPIDDPPEPCMLTVCFCNGAVMQTRMIPCEQWPTFQELYGAVPIACPLEGFPCTP